MQTIKIFFLLSFKSMKVHKTVTIKKGDTDFYLSWYNMDLLVYSTCTQWFAMENKIYETHRQSDNTSN